MGGGGVDLYMGKYGMSVIPGYSVYIMSLLPIFNNNCLMGYLHLTSYGCMNEVC